MIEIRGTHEAATLRAVRAYIGIGQVEMAEHLGVGVDSLRRMEAGDRTIPLRLLLDAAHYAGLPDVLVLEGIEGFITDRELREQYARDLRTLTLQIQDARAT